MTFNEHRILVIDDNEDVLTALRLLFERRGAIVRTATNPASVPTLLHEERFDAVLLDMNFDRDASSGQEGLVWLERILALDAAAAVVLMTAYGDLNLAVEAMKLGAVDFMTKPWQNEKVLATVHAATELRRTRTEVARLRVQRDVLASSADNRFPELLGQSPAMRQVLTTIEKVAATDASVLVLGENGTGKELVARALHRLSPRASEIFVSVDLGALPESLFESELFGHTRGAFTGANDDRAGRFEVADGGTLFLDEIGNLPLAQQARLLTVLQARVVTRLGESRPRPVNLRLVTATNQPLLQRVSEGSFRQDLLYRINTVELHLPPLRERTGDVSLLAEHFLSHYAIKYRCTGKRLSGEAMDLLKGYAWPGNVRELQHAIERAVVLAEGDTITRADFALTGSAAPLVMSAFPEERPLFLERIEHEAIRRALSKHGGNISRAAEELGLSRRSLYRRIEQYGL